MKSAIIVGSGPSGVACAWSLLRAGVSVTMLDTGLEPEPEALAVAEAYRLRQDRQAFLRAIGRAKTMPSEDLPRKTLFGSDFASRPASGQSIAADPGVRLWMSQARGGLSNLWGAAAVPFPAEEMAGWPVSAEELRPYYREVDAIMPRIGTGGDALGALFDDAHLPPPAFDPGLGPQGRDMLRDLEASTDRLARSGIVGGRARIAVAPGCRSCGLCHHGCPYDAIFNSAAQIAVLCREPGFRYRSGATVIDTGETARTAWVKFRETATGVTAPIEAERVFLACGAVATAMILAPVLGLVGDSITLRESQVFSVPFLRFRRSRGAALSRAPALAQLFLELDQIPGSTSLTHLQFYGWNDIIEDVVRQKLGIFGTLPAMIRQQIEDRIMVMFGYLHSDYGPKLQLTVPAAGLPTLKGSPAPGARALAQAAMRRLIKNRKALGGVPAAPLLDMGLPGASAHIGASFPMAFQPGKMQSDRLGRPHPLRRIHIVDASVLPSIPATTITFSVMANAARIAAETAGGGAGELP